MAASRNDGRLGGWKLLSQSPSLPSGAGLLAAAAVYVGVLML